MTRPNPVLVGVIHLPPLPGSPRYAGDLDASIERTGREARLLVEAGFDGVVVENFGDTPFFPGSVEPITVAAMTACALAAREAAPQAALGINVLRNDAEAALAVAVVARADFIRINVHSGARVTDQGVVEGAAHRTLRQRRALGAVAVRIHCDVDVKHSAPLAARPIGEEAHDLAARGMADAVLVTGSGTGRGVAEADLAAVLAAVHVPVYVASGVTEETLSAVRRAHGVIVGSTLRKSGLAGDPIDPDTARRFADAFRASRAGA
ncbi:BtpA/SgcQ family protein [Polyangium aurulentum]|uniref:BtpA/SgcQ family protein n=1 Tax=Polyangium aurulentum TaxID=2567896 RepID=UPI0010AE6CCF|nr:BtpA/SgcQ family protein [Polyangium aurulentum]UQA62544.1 BtpA/SgcQ family protein [Polyangium aurulentum]